MVAFRLCVPFSFESAISIFNTDALPTFELQASVDTDTEPHTETVSDTLPEIQEEISVPSTPVTPNEGTVNTPATPNEGTVNTPATPNEGTVSTPATPNEGTVSTPAIPNEGTVNTPATPNEGTVNTPATPNEGTVNTPATPNEGTVNAPTTPDNGTADTPVSKTPIDTYTIGVVLASVWALGVLCMLGCGMISYIKLKKRLQNAVLLYDNVYGSDRIGSPFALGVLRPRIYIPFDLQEDSASYILAHERYHLKRLDHLVKPLSFLILCIHWFNPLCWLAFNLMSLDMELSCDESVLKQYGDENMKKKYTKTLLDFATDRRYPTPAPISFSEGASAKTRIKHALYWKKPRFWVSAIAILLCAIVLVACAANAVSKDSSDESDDASQNTVWEFGETPYLFTFVSNGDGTCAITDIKIDHTHTKAFDLIVPEKSPDGDTVVEIDVSVLGNYKDVQNVPGALTKETYESIIDRIEASECKGENGIDAQKAAEIVGSFYNGVLGQPSVEHIADFSYVLLEPHIALEEATRISAYLTDFIGYTAEDCYADCLAVMELNVSGETAAILKEKAFRFFCHDVSNVQKVILPSKSIAVHQGTAELTYELKDGTTFVPKYQSSVTVGYLTDDVDLFSPDTLHFAEHQSVGDETIMVTTSKNVSKLCFFALDSTDGKTFTVDQVLLSGVTLTDAQTLVIDTYINETFPNRGIGYCGTDGKMHYYAICWSGFDGSLSLSEITDKVDFPLTLSIRYATDEDKHNDNYLHFTAPGLPVPYDLIIESTETLYNLNVCKFDARDYSDTWLYEADPFDSYVGSLTPDKSVHLTVYPESITSTYGIFFKDTDGTLRYFAIFESEESGEISLAEITSQIWQDDSQNKPSFSIPEQSTATEYPLANGTLYLVDQEDQEKQLFINYDNGSTVILAEGTNFRYLSVSPDGKKIIWNDYEWEYNATAYLFDTETGRLNSVPMDDLGENYTPSFMGWLDSRYFLFVVQFDHGTIARGGDIYVYDTQTDEYRLLIKAGSLDAHTLMIHAFEVQGEDVVFHAYDYDYDTDQYTSTQKTWSKNVLFACALGKSSLSWKIELTPIAPLSIEQVSKNEPFDFYDKEEIDRYGMGEVVHTLRLTFNRPVTQFSFIKLDSADRLTYLGPVSQDQTNLSFDAGDTYTVATYIKDVHDNRGIALSFGDGVLHYYAIRCDMIFGTYGIAEITSQIQQNVSQPTEKVLASYALNDGTLYHVEHTQSFDDMLYILHDDNSRTEIFDAPWISYVSVSPDGKKIIWNDYEWEWNATVYVYDIARSKLAVQPMDDLGENYTPSFMGWLDSRYFLFVVQFDHGTIAQGGDIYVYDTQTNAYRMLIEATYIPPRELMISSFAIEGQNIIFGGYDYDYDTDLYADWEYTISIEALYDLIKNGKTLTQKPQTPNIAPLECPVEVTVTDKEPSITFDRHAQEVFEFTFTKDVKGFAIVKIDTGVAYDITVDPLNKPTDYKAGDTLVYAMYINDIGDSRGFVLIGEDGKLHYYALRGPDMAGFKTGYSVGEVTDDPLLTVDGKTPDFNP